MKILVVEDERVSRARIVAFLREWGHEPISAGNGEEAWKVLQEQDIALVITDWLMPELDGPGLIRRVRDAGNDAAYVYFIMLTSRTEKEAVVEGMEAGADDFIIKPFDQDELRVRIRAGERVIALEQALAEKNRRLETVNTRMNNELLAAARIQRSYLPSSVPVMQGGEFAWIYEPCDELAGDTLNIVRFDAYRVGIYVLDVSGHGVASALLSVHLSRILTRLDEKDAELRKPGAAPGAAGLTPPSEVVAHLNAKFSDNPGSGQFFTLLYGILDFEDKSFRYTSAGHPGPIIYSPGKGAIHKTTPPAIGFLANAAFKEQTLTVESGDRLYLYTDGLFEIENDDGEQCGEERLFAAAATGASLPIQANLDAILAAAREWNGKDFSLPDDLSLLGVAIR